MLRGGNKAFTIIETILFLAVSSSLILIAMNSIGSKQNRVQFTDSMRSLESFINNQRSATVNGVNDSPGDCISTGGAGVDECIILGRVIIFQDGTYGGDPSDIDYFAVIGDRLTSEQASTCGNNRLRCANPRVEDSAVSRNDRIDWGAEFVSGVHRMANGDEYPSRAFGFLRDPRSSAVNIITYTDSTQDLAGGVISERTTYNTGTTEMAYGNTSAEYCFVSATGNLNAVILIEGSQVELVFDHKPGDYSC